MADGWNVGDREPAARYKANAADRSRTKPPRSENGPRDILYLRAPGTSPTFVDELTAAGWRPHVTTDPKEAEHLLKNDRIDIGLVLLGSCTEEPWWNWMEELLALGSVKWIGLIPDGCNQQAFVWQLIDTCFFDYHRFPIELDRLLFILGHAYGMAQLSRRMVVDVQSPDDWMIGDSPAMRELKKRLTRIAATDAPVLITGESGTGKELAARFVHQHSQRSGGPIEAVNCAALPATLIQSELFGHERGAFTGAYSLKIGRFEAANRGTIFLDEIGDLEQELQVNLLRVLEEGTLRRVGGSQDVPIDVRVVAATNKNLENAAKEGGFREDLYYRLNVLGLRMPPLRERGEDIGKLASHFLNVFSSQYKETKLEFTKSALQVMRDYDWPGNVRELINRIQQAAVMSEGSLITPAALNLERRKNSVRSPTTLETVRDRAEKQALLAALERSGRNISRAAKELAISRATLYRLMEKHGIAL